MSVNSKANTMHIRINPEVKARALPVLNDIGISIGDLFNMVLAQVANQHRIPFDLLDSTHTVDYTKIKPEPISEYSHFESWQDAKEWLDA